ncbi:Hypothetical protein GLP15_4242 [Giardia lamblia P15]|uniref:Uncharacterized protein n=2 Tax=Giardia intestinalis (strain P15) TaxID=658858 RepID=E1EXZ6_GIAIA|nr:Hypothetical protein GLP15_4242 [Giardia lamblia P15]
MKILKMNTTDQRRPALLIPLIFPPGLDITKQKQVKTHVESFTDAICDAVFLRKRKSPKMMVELSLLRAQPEYNVIQRIILDKLKKQRGLEQHVQLVTYPFEGTELRPLEFLHSLPTFLAVPCDPRASSGLESLKAIIPSCLFSQPFYELLTTPFYQAVIGGEPELHPIMSTLSTNFQAFYHKSASVAGQTATIGVPTTQQAALLEALPTACIKGGHRKAKLFMFPFAWDLSRIKITPKNLHIDALASLVDNMIQRYVDSLTSITENR